MSPTRQKPSVLIFAVDGLQPSQVVEELTPNIASFAAEGVFFERHHPVFPSVTRVNAASIMTGRYPGNHGLVGNTLVIREYDSTRALAALQPELTTVVARTGRMLQAPTLAEITSRHGLRFTSVGAGSSGNSFVHNPGAELAETIHPEFTIPASLNAELERRFGAWPQRDQPDHSRNDHASRILAERVLDDYDLAIYWCDEPDLTQHAEGVNSEQGKEALKIADGVFGNILRRLEENGRLADADILVVSDHGYSTSRGVISLASVVAAESPVPVVVGTNGASALFWTPGRRREDVEALAAWLMLQPWCGAITVPDAHGGIEGALPCRLVGLEGDRAPDLAMSFTWNSDANAAGVPGLAYTSGQAVGNGDHGSLSKHEMRNTLIAGGPSFRRRFRSSVPSGNVDLAPTILKIFGLPGAERMDGRALDEALLDGPDAGSISHQTRRHRAARDLGRVLYEQEITVSSVGKTNYVDQGTGIRRSAGSGSA